MIEAGAAEACNREVIRMAKGRYERWRTKEGLLLIEGWARDGLTDEQVAHNMGISRKTLYVWIEKYSDICDALKKGKDVADREVESALYRRAVGYRTKKQTRELRLNRKTGKQEMKVVKETEEEVAPDVTAAIFWLKNRKPEEWRDKRDVEIDGLGDGQQKIDDILSQIKGTGGDE